MPLLKKSSNSISRVWSGPWRGGSKDKKKNVGVNVAINIRADRLSGFFEDEFVADVADLLRK